MKKTRLDTALVERGLAPSIKVAQSIIMQGLVHTSNKMLTKPGLLIAAAENIFIKNIKSHNFVSRGGVKLEGALKSLNISVQDKICMDVGCSTGGFSQVLLQNGARHIFAIDVGYGEFDYALRIDDRITLLERTNCRYLTKEQISKNPNLIVCDVSFISLKLALLKVIEIATSGTEFLLLIKPQFEAPKEASNNGIIEDPRIWDFVCEDIAKWLSLDNNFNVKQIIASSILGVKGNKEFFIYAIKN
jgi:23S rRNA (cytidine1920-2'-O)/16S rRNA (cytidine1409-2'-O)-methyltransferase